ncbi:hypothetical protein [Devosia submarina]|uniref:hypothetical protein n=1 Tax=Devosia submarina TaxID=1173082 RepID=UPI000D384AF5|nr:hypothetical protein [Devosia submarina]
MTAEAQVQAETSYTPALVIFGKDDTGKPHASSFAQPDVGLATKAAALMGMRLLPVQTDDLRALAAMVPKGKVFASGKGFVPFVKADLFAKIEAIALANEAVAAPVIESSSDDSNASTTLAAHDEPAPSVVAMTPAVPQPTGWHDIQVGSIVLSAAVPGEMDWFECLVLSAEGEDQYKLRYCDWPSEPAFVHHVSKIGLLHPSRQPEPALDPEPTPPA